MNINTSHIKNNTIKINSNNLSDKDIFREIHKTLTPFLKEKKCSLILNDIGDKHLLGVLKELHYKYPTQTEQFVDILQKKVDQYGFQFLSENKHLSLSEEIKNYKTWKYNKIKQKKEKNIEINNNCQAINIDNKKITCRHLAFYFLMHDKEYHSEINTIENIERQETLFNNYFDKNNIINRASLFILFNLKDLGKALYQECYKIIIGDKKRFLLLSVNHVMAIIIHKKLEDKIVIKFYDPNTTISHIRLILKKNEEIINLKIEDFLKEDLINVYFPQDDINKDSFAPAELNYYDNINNTPSQISKFINLTDQNINQSLEIFFKLKFNDNSLIKSIDKILNSNLSNKEKTDLLAYNNTKIIPGFCFAFYRNNYEAINIFTNKILNSNLTCENKFEIFNSNNIINLTGLYIGFLCNYINSVINFTEKILNSNLEEIYKVLILQAKDSNGIHGIHAALRYNHSEIVIKFTEKILNSNLSQHYKRKILSIEPEYLYNTNIYEVSKNLFQNLNKKTITAFTNKILESDLDMLYKIDILKFIILKENIN